MRGSRFINRILGGLSTRESRRGAIPRSFSRFFSYARRRTRDAVPADINYCGVPDPAQKVQRCPLEIISAAGRRRCLPTDFVFFDFSSLFSLPRPLRSLRAHRALFLPTLLFFFPRSARSNRLIVLVTGPRSTHATTLAFLRRGPVQLFIATTCLPSPSSPVPSAPFGLSLFLPVLSVPIHPALSFLF